MRYLLILICFFGTMQAIVLNNQQQHFSNFTFEYYVDYSNTLEIDHIVNQSFSEVQNPYTFGYNDATYWFKLKVKNLSSMNQWMLSANEPYFQVLNIYKKVDHQWVQEKAGLERLVDQKEFYYHKPLFKLEIAHNSEETYYLQVKGKLTTANGFHLMSQNYFNSIHGYCTELLYMLFLGALIIIVLLNLFIYYRLKELMYLFYAAYIFFYALWIFAYSGLVLYTFVDGYFHEFLLVIPLFLLFLVLFSTQFLNVKEHIPKLYKVLNYVAFSFLFFAVMVVIEFNPWYQYTIYTAIVVFIMLIFISIYLVFKLNDLNIKLYLFIMSIYLFSILMLAAMVNGIVPNNDFTRYSFLYTSLFEILFFTTILINRFYIFQKERLVLQAEMIEIKKQNEIRLEAEIRESTYDIEKLLNEKELLLKELYHRVKNNFQNIIGILWIEADKNSNVLIKETFNKLISRIKSMSLIHQFLFEQKTLAHVDSEEYIENIINAIETVYQDDKITINTELQKFALSISEANHLAIVINEVITNAIKHAIVNESCSIHLELKTVGQNVHLLICDNGKGFDYKSVQRGLGLNLIQQFVEKLHQPECQFYTKNGCCFELKFQLENEHNRP